MDSENKEYEQEYERYKQRKKEAKQRFIAKQNLPYEVKVKKAELRALEFISEMYECCVDKETGEKFGWGRVLDWIGVEWEDYPATQMTLEDFLEVGK